MIAQQLMAVLAQASLYPETVGKDSQSETWINRNWYIMGDEALPYALIWQAIKDCLGIENWKTHATPAHASEAWWWLHQEEHCGPWCELIGLDHGYLVRKVDQWIKPTHTLPVEEFHDAWYRAFEEWKGEHVPGLEWIDDERWKLRVSIPSTGAYFTTQETFACRDNERARTHARKIRERWCKIVEDNPYSGDGSYGSVKNWRRRVRTIGDKDRQAGSGVREMHQGTLWVDM